MSDYARRKEQELNESNGNNENLQAQIDSLKKKIRELEVCFSTLASPQTSFGVRLSRIHFLWMRDKRTPKDVCGEAISAPFSSSLYLVCPWRRIAVAFARCNQCCMYSHETT